MTDETAPPAPGAGDPDPAMERIQRERLPGELDSAMQSGSDEGEISATERFEGDMSPEEAVEALGGEPAQLQSHSRRQSSA